jgi:hypothetical protein
VVRGSAGPRQAHRLFVWSADVFAETQDTPWSRVPVWLPEAQAALDFLLRQTGPGDTHLVCDGRSRAVRQKLESGTEKDRHLSELWVVYRPTMRLGRRVSFAPDNRETMFLSTCVPRTQIHAKDRGLYTGAGETTTHASSYTNVHAVPWPALPQIALDNKRKIISSAATLSCRRPRSSTPLAAWAERKPVASWQQLLIDLDAKCIVDLSPGSGTLARAAMHQGVLAVLGHHAVPGARFVVAERAGQARVGLEDEEWLALVRAGFGRMHLAALPGRARAVARGRIHGGHPGGL